MSTPDSIACVCGYGLWSNDSLSGSRRSPLDNYVTMKRRCCVAPKRFACLLSQHSRRLAGSDVAGVKHIAEFGVIFLLFNIGLELSYDRLVSMAKYVFGLGTLQMILTTAAITCAATAFGMPTNVAIVLGVGLSFSSTAVAMQPSQPLNVLSFWGVESTLAVIGTGGPVQ
eukprot:1190269-Prorocentrum_minimum.AAC.5